MKRFYGFALMLFMIAAPAFSSEKPASVVIPEKVMVGTTSVPAGTYKIVVTGDGPTVQVTMTKQGKTIATFSAKQIKEDGKPSVEVASRNGVTVLETISLSKYSLVVEGATQSGQ